MKNIIKKILVGGVSLTIIIIIIISAVIIIKNKFLKAEENIKTETSTIVQNQDIAKEKIPEEILVAEIENNETIEEIVQEEPVIEEKTVELEKQTKQSEVNKTEENKNTKITTQSTKQDNKISENPSTTTSKAQTNNNDNTNKPKENNNKPNVETNKNTSNTNNTSTTSQTNNAASTTPSNQKVETFKYNKQMTDKMIKVITTNESEYMKQYGYNVVVDESIIANTNQFTYTEDRVKNPLKYKFGTIKVYARDYYVNGQYMWTECFIL